MTNLCKGTNVAMETTDNILTIKIDLTKELEQRDKVTGVYTGKPRVASSGKSVLVATDGFRVGGGVKVNINAFKPF